MRTRTSPAAIDAFFPYPTEPQGTARELVFLGELDEDGWRRLASYTERLRFSPGDVVIEHGAVDRSLAIVVEGEVEILLPTADGRLSRYGTIRQSITGEIAFLDGGPRTATIRAVTPVELLRLSYEAWEVLAARNPDLGRMILFDLARILAQRLRLADETITRLQK